jgi:uncharacterized protein YndB with AHSA1/START domain
MSAEPYRDSIHIAADPEVVFDYFTKAEALACWMGDKAEVVPRPGGRFTLYFGDRRVDGRYVEVDRPKRLVISWGRAGSKTFPPGSSILEVTLTADADGTLVSIVHSGLPSDELHRHALGWQHYLARLSAAAAGQHLERHTTPSDLTRGAD